MLLVARLALLFVIARTEDVKIGLLSQWHFGVKLVSLVDLTLCWNTSTTNLCLQGMNYTKRLKNLGKWYFHFYTTWLKCFTINKKIAQMSLGDAFCQS